MIQEVIARVSSYGATIKNYALTLATALCGFGITLQRPAVVAVAFLPVVTFAVLDVQALRVERSFRGLFDRVRQEDWSAAPNFAMDLKSTPPASILEALTSPSITIFYGPLAIGVLSVWLVAKSIYR